MASQGANLAFEGGSTAVVDPSVCKACGGKAVATFIIEDEKYRLCQADVTAWTNTLVSIQGLFTREKPDA